MRVQMAKNITGVRDGSEWPPVGGVLDVPDWEGEDLIRNGYARQVADDFVPAAVDENGVPVVDENGDQIPVDADGNRVDVPASSAPVQGTATNPPLPPAAENVKAKNKRSDTAAEETAAEPATPEPAPVFAAEPTDVAGTGPEEVATVDDPNTPEDESKPKKRNGGD